MGKKTLLQCYQHRCLERAVGLSWGGSSFGASSLRTTQPSWLLLPLHSEHTDKSHFKIEHAPLLLDYNIHLQRFLKWANFYFCAVLTASRERLHLPLTYVLYNIILIKMLPIKMLSKGVPSIEVLSKEMPLNKMLLIDMLVIEMLSKECSQSRCSQLRCSQTRSS